MERKLAQLAFLQTWMNELSAHSGLDTEKLFAEHVEAKLKNAKAAKRSFLGGFKPLGLPKHVLNIAGGLFASVALPLITFRP